MDLASIVKIIQDSALGEWMRSSVKAMPFVEATHVMAITIVFGTIFIVDLRLLGYPNTRKPFTRISGELLRWTWVAFVVAVITGSLMFAANAHTYFVNTAFRFKLLTILCAGVNMAVFQFLTTRTVAAWDHNAPTSTAARMAGGISILLWTTVIFLGRWIGFTKGYDYSVPDDVNLDFLSSGLRVLLNAA